MKNYHEAKHIIDDDSLYPSNCFHFAILCSRNVFATNVKYSFDQSKAINKSNIWRRMFFLFYLRNIIVEISIKWLMNKLHRIDHWNLIVMHPKWKWMEFAVIKLDQLQAAHWFENCTIKKKWPVYKAEEEEEEQTDEENKVCFCFRNNKNICTLST